MKGDKAQKETSKAKTKNPVAKHARSFNKAQVHTDRKKAAKRGHIKHKFNPSTQSDIKVTK
jgi:hypothetical protein